MQDLAEFFGPSSPLQSLLPGFQPRAGQAWMAEAVADALAKNEQLVVEAGTGTGKSLAYLVPAALWAKANDAVCKDSEEYAALSKRLRVAKQKVQQGGGEEKKQQDGGRAAADGCDTHGRCGGSLHKWLQKQQLCDLCDLCGKENAKRMVSA